MRGRRRVEEKSRAEDRKGEKRRGEKRRKGEGWGGKEEIRNRVLNNE